MPQHRHTLILADDHPLILDGLSQLLTRGFEIVASVGDGEALVAAVARHRPSLVIADIAMPGVDGLDATRQLAARSPETRVLILSFHNDAARVRAAFAAGAWAYLSKSSVGDEIVRALDEVLAGNFYVSSTLTRDLMTPEDFMSAAPDDSEKTFAALTQREREVAWLVGEGRGNREIAELLGISVTTVRTHLSSVYAKLGLGSRVELALWAASAENKTKTE